MMDRVRPALLRASAWPLHPLAFALFPVLSLYARNQTEVRLAEIWLPASVALVMGVGAWALASLCFRSAATGAMLASPFILLFFSLDAELTLLGALRLPPRLAWVALLFVVVLVPLALWLWQHRGALPTGTRIVNLVALAVVLMPALTAGWSASVAHHAESVRATTIPSGQPRPNIYYIILDGHAAVSTLQASFSYDATPFVDALDRDGFYVVPQAHSNYGRTLLSLASSLSMSLFETRHANEEALDAEAQRLLDENAVATYLHGRGYKVVQFDSLHNPTNVALQADELIACGRATDFAFAVFDTTPLRPVLTKFFGQTATQLRTAHDHCVFGRLSTVGGTEKAPVFVFAHFLLPHSPYIYDRNGTTRPSDQLVLAANDDDPTGLTDAGFAAQSATHAEQYGEQTAFTDATVLAMVHDIQQNDRGVAPPVIIIQSDHGWATDAEILAHNDTYLQHRFRNFIAIAMPGHADAPYATLTPVNVFPLVFNAYFNADLALRPDKSYVAPPGHDGWLDDVTDTVSFPPPPALSTTARGP